MLSLNREVERGSTFTLTSDLSCIASILFANVNFYARKQVKMTVEINPYSSDGLIFSCVLTERNFSPLSLQQRGSQTSFFSNKCIFHSIFVVALVSKKKGLKIINVGCKISEVTR